MRCRAGNLISKHAATEIREPEAKVTVQRAKRRGTKATIVDGRSSLRRSSSAGPLNQLTAALTGTAVDRQPALGSRTALAWNCVADEGGSIWW